MIKKIFSAVILSLLCMLLLCIIYTGALWGIAKLAPNKGDGFITTTSNGKYYYSNVGQSFTSDKYFWSRPSAVGYNAAGSGGSNKGPANPDYLKQVQDRIDTFIAHNPTVKRTQIPSDLVTASGSGLDPDISVQGALVQVARIAKARGISAAVITALVQQDIRWPKYGMGPTRVNVLQLNLALDQLKQ